MPKRQCKAIAVTTGKQCAVAAPSGLDTCYFHTPSTAAARHAGASKGGKQKAAREATEMLERVTGVPVEPGEDGRIDIDTLADTKDYVLGRMNELTMRSGEDGAMSITESKELRGWTLVLLKIQELDGLGAAYRIRELELLVASLDSAQERRLLPAPQHEEVEE